MTDWSYTKESNEFEEWSEWPESELEIDDKEFAEAIEAGRQLEAA